MRFNMHWGRSISPWILLWMCRTSTKTWFGSLFLLILWWWYSVRKTPEKQRSAMSTQFLLYPMTPRSVTFSWTSLQFRSFDILPVSRRASLIPSKRNQSQLPRRRLFIGRSTVLVTVPPPLAFDRNRRCSIEDSTFIHYSWSLGRVCFSCVYAPHAWLLLSVHCDFFKYLVVCK